MIDRINFNLSICSISLLLSLVAAAPTTTLPDSTNAPSLSANSPEKRPQENTLSTSPTTSYSFSTLPMNFDESKAPDLTTTPKPLLSLSSRFQATSPSTMKSRKNKNDLFFCCSDDSSATTDVARRGKERERNTKPPVLKKGKNHELEEPYFERRPALLLRFFPDGTAVLISKFQLHLHVKPKQIKFEPVDEDTNLEEPLEYDGKSFEVTYKRLEAIPHSAREQNLEELPEEEEELSTGSFVAYNDDIDHRDHELVTSTVSSTQIPEVRNQKGKPSPLVETTESPQTTSPNTEELTTNEITTTEETKTSKIEETTPAMGESPFFVMTAGEMSSLQQQYDPVQAAPLRATAAPLRATAAPLKATATPLRAFTTQSPTQQEVTSTTTTEQTTVALTTLTSTFQTKTDEKTESTLTQTEPTTTTTTKCLSFRNQLSLVLSTEDNIDNSLLKKQILPTQDCNSSDEEPTDSFARLQSIDTTATESTFTTPKSTTPPTTTTTTTTTQAPTTTPYAGNNLVPYLSSRLSNNPAKPDVVVVTSLPVLIDLKNSRNKPVTEVPAWKEVTVGVVRDQQGQPLKPRYNNWTAHLRGLKKKPANKFWNELTTSRPDFKSHQRLPIQQNFQQLPSQVNNAFYADLQRHRPPMVPNSREKNVLSPPPYITNPPQGFPASNTQTFQVWRSPGYEANSRWNDNANPDYLSPHDIRRTKSLRNSPQSFEHQEARQPQQWNNAQRQMGRRW